MLTMRPLRRARISSTTRRVARMALKSDTSTTKRHVSSAERWNSLARSRALWPTLLKRMSMRPKRRRAAVIASRTAWGSVQSAVIGSACRPPASTARAVSCKGPSSRSTMTRSAPSRASRRALARPMPLAAPVTTAIRPASRLSTADAMTLPSPSDESVEADPALGGGEAEAGEHDQHGRDGGDGRIHAVLDGGEDLHGERHLARPQDEDRHRDVVERHDEREERAGGDSRADERKGHGEERHRPARAQDAGG